MDRTLTAYLLIALMIAALAALMFYLRRNTPHRRYLRQVEREDEAYRRLMEERSPS